MKKHIAVAALLGLALAFPAVAAAREVADAAPAGLPYVYTHWTQFTVKDGLPNDHIFSVKVDGPRVWVGTEDGLALHRQAVRHGGEGLEGGGRPALPGGDRHRRGRGHRRRLAGALRRRPGASSPGGASTTGTSSTAAS